MILNSSRMSAETAREARSSGDGKCMLMLIMQLAVSLDGLIEERKPRLMSVKNQPGVERNYFISIQNTRRKHGFTARVASM